MVNDAGYGKANRYIKRIEIDGLWGQFSIYWDLRPNVNILSRINEDGQDNLLNHSVGYPEQLPDKVKGVMALGKEPAELGLNSETTYFYIQGHHIIDNVVMKLLIPICTMLCRQREDEIRRLAGHNEQYKTV